jgi:photosystem II stability/assembly factor-like uncharacterized protein
MVGARGRAVTISNDGGPHWECELAQPASDGAVDLVGGVLNDGRRVAVNVKGVNEAM